MAKSKIIKLDDEKQYTDMDFFLMSFSFASYVAIRFLIEAGWIFGPILCVLLILGLQKCSKARHTIYLYAILIFTSENEQKWLLRKFSLNSVRYSSQSKPDNRMVSIEVTDAVNKTINISWPFIRSFLEEKIRQKVDFLSTRMNDTKLKPFLQYLLDFKTEEINLGTLSPVIQKIEVTPSRKVDILVLTIDFNYNGNGLLKFFTNLKSVSVENIKIKGQLRAEIGPLLSRPPFIREINVFMADEPVLDMSLSNIPDKLQNLIRILSLEKISDQLVMPNHIRLPLHKENFVLQVPQSVILIHVVEARDLPNTETFRQSDPFCVVRLGSQRAVTTTIKNNLNPKWLYKTQMICFCDPSDGNADIDFSIYDHDLFFDDFLFKSKMSVRRVKEEKFVEEWLDNEGEEGKDKTKGRLRVQLCWQNFTSEAHTTAKEESGSEKEMDKKEREQMDRNVEEAGPQYSNLCEINSAESFEILKATKKEGEADGKGEDEEDEADGIFDQLRRESKKESFSLFNAVLLVWLENAEKLEPLWEDFQIELKVYDSVEKTSFVPQDERGKWCFRHRFVIPVKGHLEHQIMLKVLSRSKNKCVGHLTLQVSQLVGSFAGDSNLKKFYLSDKDDRDLESSIYFTVVLKNIEPLATDIVNALKRAEIESARTSLEPPRSLTTHGIAVNGENVCLKGNKTSKSSTSVFNFTEIGWDVCPSFVLSNPLKTDEDEDRLLDRNVAESIHSAGNISEKQKNAAINTYVKYEEISTSKDGNPKEACVEESFSSESSRDSKRGFSWAKWKNARKINVSIKRKGAS